MHVLLKSASRSAGTAKISARLRPSPAAPTASGAPAPNERDR
jgi:hypothetical protein